MFLERIVDEVVGLHGAVLVADDLVALIPHRGAVESPAEGLPEQLRVQPGAHRSPCVRQERGEAHRIERHRRRHGFTGAGTDQFEDGGEQVDGVDERIRAATAVAHTGSRDDEGDVDAALVQGSLRSSRYLIAVLVELDRV